jgi:hypothetical protein
MIAKDKMEVLEQQFQRIFTLPVTRTTFRELQSAISTALDNDNNRTNSFIDDLLFNRDNSDFPGMNDFIKHYSIPLRVAKQVHENGEVLSMLTTDVGTQGNSGQPIFSISIRRVDGGEFHFLTDTGGFLQVAEHILTRAETIVNVQAGRTALGNVRERLEKMSKSIDNLINQAS